MVLVSVSLFLLGCPQGESGEDSGGGETTMPVILTVPRGTTFTVESDQTYTVGNGGEIRVEEGGTFNIETKAAVVVKTGGKFVAENKDNISIGDESDTGTNDAGVLIVYGGTAVKLGDTDFAKGVYTSTAGATSLSAELISALGNNAVVSDDAAVTLTQNATITGDTAVPLGVTLVVPNDKTLAVSDSAKLTVYGTLKIAALANINTTGSGSVVLKHGTETYCENRLFVSSSADGSYQWGENTASEITLSGDHIMTLKGGSFTLAKDTRIWTGTTTKIASGATLTLSPSVTYTVAGTFDQEGTFTMAEGNTVVFEHGAGYQKGTAKVLGVEESGSSYQWDTETLSSKITQKDASIELTAGKISVCNPTNVEGWPIETAAKGTTLTINAVYEIGTLNAQGTVNVNDGGELKLTDIESWEADVNTGGKFVVSAGGKIHTGATYMIGTNSDTPIIDLTDGTLTITSTAYTLDGTATFKKDFSLADGQTLTINPEKHLIVAGGAALTAIGNTKIVGTLDSSQITIENGGAIHIPATGVPDGSNFIASTGAPFGVSDDMLKVLPGVYRLIKYDYSGKSFWRQQEQDQ
jgi:hypothetical protein